jgi:iron complex outermembrane receptor protein
MTHRHNAMQRGLLPVSIALALAPAFAGAQEAAPAPAEQATTLDRIEVTGSRIRQSDIETAQPVIQVTREQIQQQGFTSVADILQNLTSAGSPAISRSQALASGEDVGGYYIDIRNLGAQRTLVLVNGKRLGISTSGLQDLSQIPVSAIERIEVLKDGGSALYGSDAIAGVVNVITRSNFDGVEANVYSASTARATVKSSRSTSRWAMSASVPASPSASNMRRTSRCSPATVRSRPTATSVRTIPMTIRSLAGAL